MTFSARLRALRRAACAGACVLAAANADWAQAWPARAVTAVVPFAAGNAIDAVGRVVLRVPAVQDRVAKLGYEPMSMTPAQFDKYFKDDVVETAKLVKAAKIPTRQRN